MTSAAEIKQSYPITIAAYCHTSGTQNPALEHAVVACKMRFNILRQYSELQYKETSFTLLLWECIPDMESWLNPKAIHTHWKKKIFRVVWIIVWAFENWFPIPVCTVKTLSKLCIQDRNQVHYVMLFIKMVAGSGKEFWITLKLC